MEEELQNSIAREGLDMEVEHRDEMEVDGNFVGSPPMDVEESGVCTTGFHAVSDMEKKDVAAKEDKHSGEDSTRVNRFKQAVISHDWELAESMVSEAEADPPALDDFLCFVLNYVWLLWTEQALYRTGELIELIVSEGACDFKRAAISSSRLALVFLGYHCQTVSPDEMDTFMDDSVQLLSDMALDITDFHPLLHGNTDGKKQNAKIDIELRIGVFNMFLELAGNNLTGEDLTEAFEGACFQLAHFSMSFYPGWCFRAAGSVISDFLCTLVERGATPDIVDRCVILAACLGSTELIEILLVIAHDNDVDVDGEAILDAACYYGYLGTAEYLIDEFISTPFGPFVRSAERGSLNVVQWFIERGCLDSEICVALTAATSSSQVEVAAYLLQLLPQKLLYTLGANIIVEAGKSKSSLEGVDFLLRSNFMGNIEGIYTVADLVATSVDGVVVPELRSFLQENWSERAYRAGWEEGARHLVNTMMVIRNGESPLQLRDLPVALRVAISYLSVYKECVGAGGSVLSQRSRGQLVVAVWRLENVFLHEKNQCRELVDVMERHLGSFL